MVTQKGCWKITDILPKVLWKTLSSNSVAFLSGKDVDLFSNNGFSFNKPFERAVRYFNIFSKIFKIYFLY